MNNNLKCIDMKTNYFSSAKSTSVFYLILGFSMVMVSCGSYKSSTYYDRDGIYGTDENENRNSDNNVDKYRDYFTTLREKNEQDQVFTDVENYSSIQDSVVNQNEKPSYSGWGNNQQPINVTIYDNNWGWNNWGYNSLWNYGWNWNFGWNSWYGPNIGYGWGWNNWYGPNIGWGWGWNNWWGPNYGYYGWGMNNFNNPYYSYSNGIRGGRSSGRVSGRYDFGRNGIANNRDNSSIGRRNSASNGVRNSDQRSPRTYNAVRVNDVNPRSTNGTTRFYNPTRADVSNPRSDSESPRSYTPVRSEPSSTRSESASPRSYSPSPSSGGGSFGGGGRSGGSGGGGRR
jgi:hypothetical protein